MMLKSGPIEDLKSLPKRQCLIVDPGIRNLSIAYIECVYLFHFDNVYNLLNDINFNNLLDMLKNESEIHLVCENQLFKKNILLQGILCGYIFSKIKIKQFYWFTPHLKNKFTLQFFNFQYQKIKSNKQFLQQPLNFRQSLFKWKLVEHIGEKTLHLNFIEYKKIKKKDDFIDCIIMSKSLDLL